MPSTTAIMLMLAALAVAIGLVVVLAPIMILRYILGWQILVFVLAALVLLAAPLVYAWRTRPFQE